MATPDDRVLKIIRQYSNLATGAMIAIPVPGVDIAATTAVWARMIREIALAEGEVITLGDARALAADLFKSVVLVSVAWFASAKTASFVLKFIPGAGTLAGYLVDATVAALGARKITAALGFAAVAYYRSGKQVDRQTLAQDVARVLRDPEMIALLLTSLVPALRKVRKR